MSKELKRQLNSVLTDEQKEEIDSRLELHHAEKSKNYSLVEIIKEAKAKLRK